MVMKQMEYKDALALRNKGGKSALAGFKYMLGLSVIGGGH